jgi:hypothetical protein
MIQPTNTPPQGIDEIPKNVDITGPTERSSTLFKEWVTNNRDKCILPGEIK